MNVLVLLMTVAVVVSLKCYNAPQGYINNAVQNATLLDCVGVAYSCIKVVDYSLGTYTKGCNTQNCTPPNTLSNYGPAQCYSNGAPRYQGDTSHNITSCCCYGDGCNSAFKTLVGSTIVFTLLFASL